MRQTINHAARVWKVDVISMSFSFRDQVFSIKEAIEKCASQSKIIFLTAASRNEGRNSSISFPAAYNHLVIPIISTNSLGQLSGFNPPPHRGCERFATLGENVLSAWPFKSFELFRRICPVRNLNRYLHRSWASGMHS